MEKKKYKVTYTRSIIVNAVDDYYAKHIANESEGWEENNGEVEEL